MLKSLILLVLSLVTLSFAQFTQQGNKLVGTGSLGTTPEQGSSVALSADGNTAIVGGWDDDFTVGAAWVFVRAGGAWTQQAKLVGTGGAGSLGSYQGYSVALSADGNTAAVGGYMDNDRIGAVWIFIRSGTVWSQQGTKLVGTGVVNVTGHQSYQGFSVGISADGNTVIVGGEYDNNTVGAAWIFARSGGVWTQQGSKLVGAGYSGQSYQGCSVAISGDGNTAIVGGNYDAPGYGAVWIYKRWGGTWIQQGVKIIGTGTVGTSGFGSSVALSTDGNTAIVGGSNDNDGIGALWVFSRSVIDSTWKAQGTKLVGTGYAGATPYQGVAASLSGDGNTALIGGYYDSTMTGAAWIFKRSLADSSWTQQGSKLVGTNSAGDPRQGISTGLSSDGNTAILGGFADSNFVGAAWVFVTPNAPLAVELARFSVFVNGLNAELHWETKTEVNNSGFEIQRRIASGNVASGSPADGSNWANLGFVSGAGTSNSPKHYSFSDNIVLGKTYFYRLKQTDQNGTFNYSEIVTLKSALGPQKLSLDQNYPNPFNPSTRVSFTVQMSGRTTLTAYDVLGQYIAPLFDGVCEAGRTYNAEFVAEHLPSGLYFVRLESGGQTAMRKMMLVR